MDRLFANRIWGIPWTALAAIAIVIMVVYLVVDTSKASGGVIWFVQRWFHSLCWLFLGLAATAMAGVTPIPSTWAGGLAVTGGILYAIFLVASVTGGSAA